MATERSSSVTVYSWARHAYPEEQPTKLADDATTFIIVLPGGNPFYRMSNISARSVSKQFGITTFKAVTRTDRYNTPT